jgi:hypothetical protein
MGAISGSREPSPDGLGPSGFDPERKQLALHYARYIRKLCGTTSNKPGVSMGRATMLDLADFLEEVAK